MSYKPLHHKYRPQTFADLVGQDAIATALSNALTRERIAPAYLFAGPRGTGKTSSARILAKSLNCLSSDRPTPTPCGQCQACRAIARGSALDVIEIDAASNTGVDNIREIIERAQFAPVQCRYKLYLIDEVHMLSVAAFNALLKTLEEPPARVVFVLATTDPQRVLPTILSRCQRFDFRRIPLADMVSHLQKIAAAEDIEITEAAVTLVAQIANGGLRDAESLLDQLGLLTGTVTIERVWDLVGAIPEHDLLALLQAIYDNDAAAVLHQCRHLMDRGREPLVVLQNLAGFYRDLLIAKTAPHCSQLVALTAPTWQQLCAEAQRWDIDQILRGQGLLKASEAQLKTTTQPRLWLEVTLLNLLPVATSQPSTPPPAANKPEIDSPQRSSPVSPPERANNGNSAFSPAQSQTNGKHPPADPVPPAQPTEPTPQPPPSLPPTASPAAAGEPPSPATDQSAHWSEAEIWNQVLASIQPKTTRELLRQMCHLVALKGSVAHIWVKTKPLLKMAQERKQNIEAAFERVCQQKISVSLSTSRPAGVSEPAPPANGKPSTPTKTEDQPASAIAPRPQVEPSPAPTENNSPPPQPVAPADSSPTASPQPTPTEVKEEPVPINEEAEDAVSQAAQSLAEAFKGEIVSLDYES